MSSSFRSKLSEWWINWLEVKPKANDFYEEDEPAEYIFDIYANAYAPHCDSSILHSPGVCEYCDHYPEWQHYRKVARIAFSDEVNPEDKAPCPSTYFRPAEVRDRWGGNVPNGSWQEPIDD